MWPLIRRHHSATFLPQASNSSCETSQCHLTPLDRFILTPVHPVFLRSHLTFPIHCFIISSVLLRIPCSSAYKWHTSAQLPRICDTAIDINRSPLLISSRTNQIRPEKKEEISTQCLQQSTTPQFRPPLTRLLTSNAVTRWKNISRPARSYRT